VRPTALQVMLSRGRFLIQNNQLMSPAKQLKSFSGRMEGCFHPSNPCNRFHDEGISVRASRGRL
jgi:hypothetical protein